MSRENGFSQREKALQISGGKYNCILSNWVNYIVLYRLCRKFLQNILGKVYIVLANGNELLSANPLVQVLISDYIH